MPTPSCPFHTICHKARACPLAHTGSSQSPGNRQQLCNPDAFPLNRLLNMGDLPFASEEEAQCALANQQERDDFDTDLEIFHDLRCNENDMLLTPEEAELEWLREEKIRADFEYDYSA